MYRRVNSLRLDTAKLSFTDMMKKSVSIYITYATFVVCATNGIAYLFIFF